jgi:hypothetical protein
LDSLETALKIIGDNIEARVEAGEWERWEDPGEYPNGLASSPLPPGKPEFTYDDESPVAIPWEALPTPGLVFDEDNEGLLLSEGRVHANSAYVDWTVKSVRVDAAGITVTLSFKFEADDGL